VAVVTAVAIVAPPIATAPPSRKTKNKANTSDFNTKKIKNSPQNCSLFFYNSTALFSSF
jgi:hypothetical protein